MAGPSQSVRSLFHRRCLPPPEDGDAGAAAAARPPPSQAPAGHLSGQAWGGAAPAPAHHPGAASWPGAAARRPPEQPWQPGSGRAAPAVQGQLPPPPSWAPPVQQQQQQQQQQAAGNDCTGFVLAGRPPGDQVGAPQGLPAAPPWYGPQQQQQQQHPAGPPLPTTHQRAWQQQQQQRPQAAVRQQQGQEPLWQQPNQQQQQQPMQQQQQHQAWLPPPAAATALGQGAGPQPQQEVAGALAAAAAAVAARTHSQENQQPCIYSQQQPVCYNQPQHFFNQQHPPLQHPAVAPTQQQCIPGPPQQGQPLLQDVQQGPRLAPQQQQQQGPRLEPQQQEQRPSSGSPSCGTAPPLADTAPAPPKLPPRRPKQPLRLTLSEWGLPPGVVQAFESRGVRRMYPWQAAALECGEEYNNLVYCAPTSGGKSLVAEVLMVRCLLRSQQDILQPRRSKPKYGRVLVVLPYVSIVNEKSEHLEAVLMPMHASVKGFSGGGQDGAASQPLAPRGETVAVCTIEKANVAINRLAQEGRLGELCCVVVDELHMVSDGDRGIGLEMSLSKLLFSPAARHVQIIGMSATMGGLEALRSWLRAELFLTNFRPVPLTEHVVVRGKVYEKIGPQELAELRAEEEEHPPLRELREVAPSEGRRDVDRLVPLVAEATSDGHSVLVFCSSRKQCEAAAALIADLLPQIAPPPPERQAELAAQRQGIITDIKIAMGGAMSAELEACMLQGIAWHHAALTSEERAGVERAYRAGAVQVITATSTLAAGVNLPARRVILRSLHQGVGPVSRSQYLQMVGRAGRAGHAAAGESFLIGRGAACGQEWRQICALLTAPIPCLVSRVMAPEAAALFAAKGEVPEDATRHLQQLLLEGIATGSVSVGVDVERLVCSTFAAHQQGRGVMALASRAALRELIKEKRLVQWAAGQEGRLDLTHKGRAVYNSALPLRDAMVLYDSCAKAEDGFMLDRPLVLIYHCLLSHPFAIVSWAEWARVLAGLDARDQDIALSVGVEHKHAVLVMGGRTLPQEIQDRHGRLAAALALGELTSEKDIQGVVARWGREGFVSRGLSRGQIQKMQQDVGKWMGMASLLCESAGWWPLATLYSNLSQMAAAGVRQDLLPLLKVPEMDAAKARALFKAGFRDAQVLATADEAAVAKALVPAIAQQMRSRSSSGNQSAGASAASAANYAAVGIAARASATLVQSAREHLRRQMRELAALTADIAEDEEAAAAAQAAAAGAPAGGGAGKGGSGSGAAGTLTDDLSAAELAHIKHQVAQLGGSGLPGEPGKATGPEVTIAPVAHLQWTQGVVRVTELRPRSTPSQLEEFFSLWAAQPRFALALHSLADEELAAAAAGMGGSAGGKLLLPGATAAAAGAEPQQRLQGMAVCWDLQQAFYVELSATNCARELRRGGGTTVLDAIHVVLAQASHKVCYRAVEALPELMALGVRVGGQLEDPRAAGALLWPDAAADDPAILSLKRLQASVAPRYKARVPTLCRSGVTDTTRSALLALACMEPLKQLLAHRSMLEAFTHLDMPSQLAVLHMNASPAAPRLCLPPLLAALEAAQASAALAQEQLQHLYGMPHLDLSSDDTMLQLLSSLKMAHPERRKRGKPNAPLEHLQLLQQRCRPHQRQERQVLSCMVQHKSLTQHLVAPLQSLLELASGQPAQRPGSGQAAGASVASAQLQKQGPTASAAGRPLQAVQLRLEVCTASGRLTYGEQLDRHLAALLAAQWSPFQAAGSNQSLQAELASGALSAEAIAAAAAAGGGLPVVLCVPRRQLAARGGGLRPAAEGSSDASDAFDDGETEAEVWVCGRLHHVLGKRLCTALDFACGRSSGPCSGGSSQRPSVAVVRVPLLQDDDAARLDAAPFGASWAATPRGTELTWPCDQMWRLAGPSAAILSGAVGGGGIISGCSSVEDHQPQAAAAAAALSPLTLQGAVTWGLAGYCSGAAVFAAADAGAANTAAAGGAAVDGSLRRKAPHNQQQGQEQCSDDASSDGSSLLLRVQLENVELAVLAHLSGQPELQAACLRYSSGGSPGGTGSAYEHVSNMWAAAVGQVEVPGSGAGGAGQPQPPVLISATAVQAVVQALVHHWSAQKLGWVLRVSKPGAAAVLDSFLSAFPRLQASLAEVAVSGEAACCAATLAGRQRQFSGLKRADDAMGRGKLHKAILQHVLEGSVADVLRAALVSTRGALAAIPTTGAGQQQQQAQAQEKPEVVLVLGHSLVLRLPAACTATLGGTGAAASAVAAAVERGLRSLYIGRALLAAPLAAVVTAGPSLHLWDQANVLGRPGQQQPPQHAQALALS